MKSLQVFKNDEFGTVRTVTIDGEPYFVGKDVAEILGYSNASKAVISHVDEDDKQFVMLDIADSQNGNVLYGQSKTAIINESGLYSLILSSKLPTAKKFKRWVTNEVLPSIRKHGMYAVDDLLNNPDTMIAILTELKEERNKNKTLQVENSQLAVDNTIMKPKADYFDELVDRNLLTNFRDTAKMLSIKQKDFIKFLLDRGYIYRDKKGKLMPYADKNNGLFEVKESYNEKTDWAGSQTLITPKGRETFRLLLI